MAGWLMFDATLAMSVASLVLVFFGISTSCKSFERGIAFKCRFDLERPLLVIEHKEKKEKFVPPLLEKKHFSWTDFFET